MAEKTDLVTAMDSLPAKGKEPASTRVLDNWVYQAERQLSSDGGRLGRLVASTVAAALLGRVVDEEGLSRFALKGGMLLQYRLGSASRATTDLDGIVKGGLDSFFSALDEAMREPWGCIGFSRGEVREFEVPAKVVNPRRFDLTLSVRGKSWRRVQVELSPDEGAHGVAVEPFAPPSLGGFGIPTPDELVGISLAYQVAEKVHAATDPHDPPEFVNERARDVVDLLLLRDLIKSSGVPVGVELLAAIEDVFAWRASEVMALGRPSRPWPARLTAYSHWTVDYARAAESAGVGLSLGDAVDQVNAWLDEIEAPRRSLA